jgi:hypothetical protein
MFNKKLVSEPNKLYIEHSQAKAPASHKAPRESEGDNRWAGPRMSRAMRGWVCCGRAIQLSRDDEKT